MKKQLLALLLVAPFAAFAHDIELTDVTAENLKACLEARVNAGEAAEDVIASLRIRLAELGLSAEEAEVLLACLNETSECSTACCCDLAE